MSDIGEIFYLLRKESANRRCCLIGNSGHALSERETVKPSRASRPEHRSNIQNFDSARSVLNPGFQ